MALQVFASIDLVRHIYSYGPEHREKLAMVLESLKNPTAKDLGIEKVSVSHSDVFWDYSVVDYFKDVRCRCCSRHSYRKTYPVVYGNRLCFAPGYSCVPEENDLGDCECYCRQRSRRFVKLVLTYSDI